MNPIVRPRRSVPLRSRGTRTAWQATAVGVATAASLIGSSAFTAVAAAPGHSSRSVSHPGALVHGSYAKAFAHPSPAVRPKFRWWWPGADVDLAEIRREVRQIARAGFGGVEIADVFDSVTADINPDRFGWGTPRWNRAVRVALTEAKKQNLVVDLTVGPHWPSVIPGITPNDRSAAQELTYGRATVAGGGAFDAAVPLPTSTPTGQLETDDTQVVPTLVSLQALRCSANCADDASAPAELDQASGIDLTDRVQDGHLTWTAPAGETWVLVASWDRGTAQVAALNYFPGVTHSPLAPGGNPYVVNHFSKAGAHAVTNYWNKHLLAPRTATLLRQTGGAIFEDSLELRASVQWTPELLARFRDDHGYSLRPYLPVLFSNTTGGAPGVPSTSTPVFTFGDDVTDRVTHDYEQTLSNLYLDNRVRPLKRWAHSLGLKYRVQPYGEPVDSALVAATTDIPEGESLGFSDLDSFRLLAGGRDLGGRRILSDEAGAFFGQAYNTTWDQMLATINSNYSAGVNQAVLHGFAYQDAPGASWPGFAPFTPFIGGPGFAEPWGPREPTWRHVDQVSGYLARTQKVLQTGRNDVDVAIFHQAGNASSGAPFFEDSGLRDSGYSYNFVSPGTLRLPRASVADGVLAPDGPSYKALVLDNQSSIDVDVLRKVLKDARAGLPVVVVGSAPSRAAGYADAGASDVLVARLSSRLVAQGAVRQVDTEAEVPAALTAAAVRPDMTPAAETTSLAPVHRVKNGTDYYFLSNAGDTAAAETVTLQGGGKPYLLDAWTGRVTRVGTYHRTKSGVAVDVDVAPGDATIVALADTPWAGHRSPWVHVVATDADAVVTTRKAVFVRASQAGRLTTHLSNGRTVHTRVRSVPGPVSPDRWRLVVDDWRPGATATQTEHVRHVRRLTRLVPWSQIPGLENVSGVGTYTTTLTLPHGWCCTAGTTLDLGAVTDTFRVSVNGHVIRRANQVDPMIEVGRYLRAGRNVLKVEVASTLNNRLRVSNPDVFGSQPKAEYGLLGPVTLQPYRQLKIWPLG